MGKNLSSFGVSSSNAIVGCFRVQVSQHQFGFLHIVHESPNIIYIPAVKVGLVCCVDMRVFEPVHANDG